jgi:hypothetical protein
MRQAMRMGSVLTAIECLSRAGITSIVYGGWGLDALIGRQTREHVDLDLIIPESQIRAAPLALSSLLYETVSDCLPLLIRLRRPDGGQVDMHPLFPRQAPNVAFGWLGGAAVFCLDAGTSRQMLLEMLKRAPHRATGTTAQDLALLDRLCGSSSAGSSRSGPRA